MHLPSFVLGVVSTLALATGVYVLRRMSWRRNEIADLLRYGSPARIFNWIHEHEGEKIPAELVSMLCRTANSVSECKWAHEVLSYARIPAELKGQLMPELEMWWDWVALAKVENAADLATLVFDLDMKHYREESQAFELAMSLTEPQRLQAAG